MEKHLRYNLTSPTYNEIKTFVSLKREEYLNKIFNLKSQYLSLMSSYDYKVWARILKNKKNIELAIIMDTISLFKNSIKDVKSFFINGGHARNMNRWHSDLDLNFLYSDSKHDELFVIEEIISIMLYQILGYIGRDKVHPAMVNFPIEFNKPITLTSGINYIIFPDGKYYYKCRKYSDRLLYRIKNSLRSVESFKNYIEENTKNVDCLEWCYSFEELPIKNEVSIYDIISKNNYMNIEYDFFSRKINKHIDELLDNILKENEVINFKKIRISDFNKKIKVKNISYIYQVLTLIKVIADRNGENIINLDYYRIINSTLMKSMCNSNEISVFTEVIFEYLWLISRVENVMEKKKYNFSAKERSEITYKRLLYIYYEEYNSNFEDDYKRIFNKLRNNLILILYKLRKE